MLMTGFHSQFGTQKNHATTTKVASPFLLSRHVILITELLHIRLCSPVSPDSYQFTNFGWGFFCTALEKCHDCKRVWNVKLTYSQLIRELFHNGMYTVIDISVWYPQTKRLIIGA